MELESDQHQLVQRHRLHRGSGGDRHHPGIVYHLQGVASQARRRHRQQRASGRQLARLLVHQLRLRAVRS